MGFGDGSDSSGAVVSGWASSTAACSWTTQLEASAVDGHELSNDECRSAVDGVAVPEVDCSASTSSRDDEQPIPKESQMTTEISIEVDDARWLNRRISLGYSDHRPLRKQAIVVVLTSYVLASLWEKCRENWVRGT